MMITPTTTTTCRSAWYLAALNPSESSSLHPVLKVANRSLGCLRCTEKLFMQR